MVQTRDKRVTFNCCHSLEIPVAFGISSGMDVPFPPSSFACVGLVPYVPFELSVQKVLRHLLAQGACVREIFPARQE